MLILQQLVETPVLCHWKRISRLVENPIVYSIFLIFSGAAIVSTLVLYTRQSLLVAYLILGALIGPFGFKWVADSTLIHKVSDIGVIFLLFLLGLNLHPQKLWHSLKGSILVGVLSSVVLAFLGFIVGRLFDFSVFESLVIGTSLMFSSTIIGLKLLPTTILHHRHTGELMISILLLQDILAIIVLFWITASQHVGPIMLSDWTKIVLSLPTLMLLAFLGEKFIISKLFVRFDHIKEYIFLLSIGWCLSLAQFSGVMGLSEEIGAFVAGVAIAASPIALYISENLKPLRDFFLVLFFFSIGASFNFHYLHLVIMPAFILTAIAVFFKPPLFYILLCKIGENAKEAWEVGIRLAQASEFSLLVAYLAASPPFPLISNKASYLIQAMTIMSFFVSSYWVVLKYPTPLAMIDRMRRD